MALLNLHNTDIYLERVQQELKYQTSVQSAARFGQIFQSIVVCDEQLLHPTVGCSVCICVYIRAIH